MHFIHLSKRPLIPGLVYKGGELVFTIFSYRGLIYFPATDKKREFTIKKIKLIFFCGDFLLIILDVFIG